MDRRTDDRPGLLVSNVVATRVRFPAFQRLIDRLSTRFVQIASEHWDVTVSFAQDEGGARSLDLARRADAVVILGGEDVAPDLYGAEAGYPRESVHLRRADEAQIALVREAVGSSRPLLGICRGLQVLDVALGGTLVRDHTLPGHRSETLLEDLVFPRHALVVDRSTRLAPALVDPQVHSAHHQALDRLGEGLRVVATAPDGTVEAVEHERAPVYGVQWHPEDPDADPEGLRALLGRLRAHVHPTATVV